jgi:hypothetical protein
MLIGPAGAAFPRNGERDVAQVERRLPLNCMKREAPPSRESGRRKTCSTCAIRRRKDGGAVEPAVRRIDRPDSGVELSASRTGFEGERAVPRESRAAGNQLAVPFFEFAALRTRWNSPPPSFCSEYGSTLAQPAFSRQPAAVRRNPSCDGPDRRRGRRANAPQAMNSAESESSETPVYGLFSALIIPENGASDKGRFETYLTRMCHFGLIFPPAAVNFNGNGKGGGGC